MATKAKTKKLPEIADLTKAQAKVEHVRLTLENSPWEWVLRTLLRRTLDR